ncbi:hypothetical protein [Frankia sp. Cj5]|uniref:hypothetical protein n=1 Tax=Frankia sp. Cj5 TaxID=2880978 RepID=UPI001EF467AE|nr:hypothetical protein [Frankia sp. Cj5]
MTVLTQTTTFVEITSRCEGLHHWPEAPPQERYLRDPHRHTFVAVVRVQVFHDDRDIEINALARWLNHAWTSLATSHREIGDGRLLDFGTQSCEQFSRAITQLVIDRHGDQREITCTVLEDGLLGGGITYRPTAAAHETASPR